MSASITSGTYGRQPALGGALRQFLGHLLGGSAAPVARPAAVRAVGSFRSRVREANDVRALA
ncbi:MAG TPA: hypothetical protein VF457_02620, partial [Burkholderiaceae bacterium]